MQSHAESVRPTCPFPGAGQQHSSLRTQAYGNQPCHELMANAQLLLKGRFSHRLAGWRCDSRDAICISGDSHRSLSAACSVRAGNEDVGCLHTPAQAQQFVESCNHS